MIKIPKVFFIDHYERDLPTPVIQHETNTNIFIDENDPYIKDLVEDAKYYADPHGPDDNNLRRAAKFLLKAIEREKPEK